MGWWSAGKHGGISGLLDEPAGGEQEMYWGDGPADILDEALEKVAAQFANERGRQPTRSELKVRVQVQTEAVAAVMTPAIEAIMAEYREAWGRDPYPRELEVGLEFCLGFYSER